ncbi:hypothetical protein [Bradyrhizobium pachyrhizi]|uniref:hypothetical protein n=1 Tax=Bradyrhizobium pachyrhizi TaxID=280333 RepID=UPI00067A7568|nr:hypothetical protein [Bradyrhizobium pachyrhizi]
MVTLTATDGSRVDIDAAEVVRARRTISGERGGDNGNAQTRVDWSITQLVLETIDEVAPVIKAALPSFTCLTTTDGSKIWFDALKASGPLPITTGQKQNGVNSSIKIMGYRQYVTETPQEVRTVIQQAGGTPVT